jgi:hypothetical protein
LGDNKNVLKLFQMKNIDGDDDCTALWMYWKAAYSSF